MPIARRHSYCLCKTSASPVLQTLLVTNDIRQSSEDTLSLFKHCFCMWWHVSSCPHSPEGIHCLQNASASAKSRDSEAYHPEGINAAIQRAAGDARRENRGAVAHASAEVHRARRCPLTQSAVAVAQRRARSGLPLSGLVCVRVGDGQPGERAKARGRVEVAPPQSRTTALPAQDNDSWTVIYLNVEKLRVHRSGRMGTPLTGPKLTDVRRGPSPCRLGSPTPNWPRELLS